MNTHTRRVAMSLFGCAAAFVLAIGVGTASCAGDGLETSDGAAPAADGAVEPDVPLFGSGGAAGSGMGGAAGSADDAAGPQDTGRGPGPDAMGLACDAGTGVVCLEGRPCMQDLGVCAANGIFVQCSCRAGSYANCRTGGRCGDGGSQRDAQDGRGGGG